MQNEPLTTVQLFIMQKQSDGLLQVSKILNIIHYQKTTNAHDTYYPTQTAI